MREVLIITHPLSKCNTIMLARTDKKKLWTRKSKKDLSPNSFNTC